MERRKILLGSGAALATALAGCSGDETSDDDDPDDTESIGNGNGDSPDDGDNGDNGDDGTDPDVDDVPGLDGTKLDLDTDAVSIKKIERKGDEVGIVATSEVTDLEELYPELRTMAGDLEDAVDDLETFAAKIKTLDWTLEHDGKQVVSFYVDVSWLVDYYDGELSEDEFLEMVKDTAE